MDIVIFYEHFVREVENDLLIKNELEKRGYTVFLSSFSMCSYGKAVLKYRPQVVLTPWLRYDDNIWRFTRFLKKPRILINLQWEQIYSEFDKEVGMVNVQDKARYAYHLCWGENSKNELLKLGVPADHLEITGAVQLDFCNNLFKNYYLTKQELGDEFCFDSQKKWHLFISSFSMVTYNKADVEKMESEWGFSYSEFINLSKKSKKILLKWIKEFLEKNPNDIFVYRPHPSEINDSSLITMEKEVGNFYVISQYSIKQWIKVCDVINNWFSTSIAEVYACKKMCYLLRPIKIPERYDFEILKKVKPIKTKEEFFQVNKSKEINKDYCLAPNIFDKYYSVINNKPAYVRIADYIDKMLKDNKKSTPFEFTKEEKKKFRKLHNTDILLSLYADFYRKSRIRLSNIILFKKKQFRNIEDYIDTKFVDAKIYEDKIREIMR